MSALEVNQLKGDIAQLDMVHDYVWHLCIGDGVRLWDTELIQHSLDIVAAQIDFCGGCRNIPHRRGGFEPGSHDGHRPAAYLGGIPALSLIHI